MKKVIFPLLFCLFFSACGGTIMKVAKIDDKTGYITSANGEVKKATVITSKKLPLAAFKGMAYSNGEFSKNQLKAIGYFDQVLDYNDLQKLVVANNLQDKVPTLNEPIGLNKLYRAYKPFLWVTVRSINKDNGPYLQLVAVNPESLEDVFISEVYLDHQWAGVNDQNSLHPLYNALIEWIKENS